MSEPINADFVDIKLRPAQSLVRIILECPIEYSDEVLKKLGGFPRPGESRYVKIELLDEQSGN